MPASTKVHAAPAPRAAPRRAGVLLGASFAAYALLHFAFGRGATALAFACAALGGRLFGVWGGAAVAAAYTLLHAAGPGELGGAALLLEGCALLLVGCVAGARRRPAPAAGEPQPANPGSETPFRLAVESLGEALIFTDSDDRITYANPRTLELLGYTPAELFGRVAHELLSPPEEHPRMRARLAGRRGGAADRYEILHRRKDGAEVWVEVSAVPLLDEGGAVAGTIGSLTDIVKRRGAERALRDARARAQETAERMRALAAAGAGVIAAQSLEELRDVLHELCGEVVPFDAFVLARHHPERGTLTYLRVDDAGAPLPAVEEPAAAPDAVVVAERRPLLAPHPGADGHGGPSAIHVPVLGTDGVMGVIAVHSHSPRAYDARDVEVLETMAALTGGALANLRLLEERRAAEATLRASEERFRSVVEHAADALFVHDFRGRLLDVNQRACDLLGYTRDEMLALNLMDVEQNLSPDGAAELLRRLEGGETVTFQGVHRRKDGSTLPVEVRVVAFSSGGEPRVLGVARDVTERALAEAALRESETRFRAVFTHAALGIALADSRGHALAANPAMEAMLGYTAEELSRMRWAEYTHPDDVEPNRTRFLEMLQGRHERYALEKRYLHRDGHVVWAHLVVSLIRGAQGEPSYVLAMIEDVTERRRAEEAHRASEARYQRIAANMPGMVYQFVAYPDGRRSFPFVSEGSRRIYELEPEEIQANPDLIIDIVHPDDRAGFESSVARSAQRMEPWAWEGRIILRGGEERWLQGASRPELQDDGSIRWDGMLMDATAQRRVEEALKQSQQQLLQAQKMEAVGRLAGGVAHDFNNMLTAIRGNTELLLMDTPPEDPRRADLEEIRRAADRSADLTRQLLAFSRQQLLQPRVLDLNRSVAAMERMLRRVIGEDIELTTTLEPALGVVTADPGQVEQVVLNLAVNARDAMPRGGRLRIRTDNVVLAPGDARLGEDAAPGRYVALRVADSGCGMDGATLARIWDPFFTTKEQGKGTGLGLATVYGIVRQSGGTVWAESAPDRGTSITVYLPRTDVAAEAEGAAQGTPAPIPRGFETILVVEDEASVRRLTTRVLTRSGFQVLEACNAAEALELFAVHGERVNMVLTDLVMPGMDGTRLASLLRERNPALRVLLATGYSAEALDPERVRPGEMILLKPFDPATLVRRVREVLDS